MRARANTTYRAKVNIVSQKCRWDGGINSLKAFRRQVFLLFSFFNQYKCILRPLRANLARPFPCSRPRNCMKRRTSHRNNHVYNSCRIAAIQLNASWTDDVYYGNEIRDRPIVIIHVMSTLCLFVTFEY